MSKNKIKVLIELDEELFKNVIEQTKYGYIGSDVWIAVAHGTPLPKGHGRLIEEPTETDISNTVGGNNDFAECVRDSVKAVFDNATTIVEADKENDNA